MKLPFAAGFYQGIYRRFHLLFWPAFLATFIVASIQLKQQAWLINETAPEGIVSLELGRTLSRDTTIIRSWKQASTVAATSCLTDNPPVDRLKVAESQVWLDDLFIPLYTFLAIVIIATLQTRIKKEATLFSKVLLWLAVLAGCCDMFENIGLLNFIHDGRLQSPAPGLMNLPRLPGPSHHLIDAPITGAISRIKFGILIFLGGVYLPLTLIFKDEGLQKLSAYIREKSGQLFRYRVILISVFIFVIPIWVLDQGQDLLVNSNSSDEGVLLFLGVVTIAAFLNWYLAKLFFEKTYTGPVCPMTEPVLSDPLAQKAEKKVSRFLGVSTILLPAVAILNALETIRIPSRLDFFPPLLWLLGLLSLFFAGIQQDLATRAYTWMENKWGPPKSKFLTLSLLIILGLFAPGFIRFVIIRGASNTPDSLVYLFGHLVLLAIAFTIFVSVRTFIFPDSSWLGRKIGWPILLSACSLALLFIALNFFPLSILSLDCNYLSLPVLLCGIIFYILLFTLLIRVSLWKKINFLLLFFVTGLIISISASNDYHAVKQTNRASLPPPLSLEIYFKQWLLQRKEEIDRMDSFPVFLVNSYGGGIRAAAFTNMVFSYLDSTLIANRKDHKGFEHFVFSVSGASGGTVGAAIQCAYRAKYLDGSSQAYSLDSFQHLYHHDFLTPVLSNLLGADTWASMTSFHLWKDRSEIQEDLWEGWAGSELHLQLGGEFNALWDTSRQNPARYEVPLLFSNTLNVDDGLKGICAPVTLEPADFPATIFIRSRIDALNAAKDKDSLQSLSLITGAFLSARFPFISPSGKMGPGYHFMDGGGKDNSGASTSEAVFIALARLACREKDVPADSVFCRLMRKVRFHFVSITNSPYYNPDTRQLVSNRFEPISPLVGIVNSGIYGNAQAADNTLQFQSSPDSVQFQGIRSDYCAVWITGSCIPDGEGTLYAPILPLGWQISAPSLQRLRQSFDRDKLQSYDAIGIPKILAVAGGD